MATIIVKELLVHGGIVAGEYVASEVSRAIDRARTGPDGNCVLIKTGDIPDDWQYKCYTYNKDDSWMLKSYWSETLTNRSERLMSAGQPVDDTFKLRIYEMGDTLLGDLIVKAGDVVVVNCCMVAGNAWNIVHNKAHC